MASRSTSRATLYAWRIPFLLVFALSACGVRDFADTGTTPPPTPIPQASSPTPTAGSSDDDRLLLQLHVFNGQPPESEFASTGALFNLYQDGRVITPAVYDGSTNLRPLQVTLLSAAGVQVILDEARAGGLLDGQSFTNAPWVDNPYILLVSYLGDEPVSVSAHAMGFVPVAATDEIALSESLTAFSEKLFNIGAWLPEGSILEEAQPYRVERLQIATLDITGSYGQSELDWPLETPLSGRGTPGFLGGMHCFILEGDEMRAVLGAFEEADTLGYHQPLWLSDGKTFLVYPRVLPPDDQGCYVVGANVPIRIFAEDNTIEHGMLPGNVLISINVHQPSESDGQLDDFPLVTLLGDGSVVMPPPQGEEHLLLSAPQVTRISLDGIQMVLREAQAAGLLDGSQRYSTIDPAQPVTVFHIFPDEPRRATIIVPGLGIAGTSGTISSQESEARARLQAFVDLATHLRDHLPAEDVLATNERYSAELFQWITQPAELSGLPDDAGPIRHFSWNFDVPIKSFGDPANLEGSICATVGTEILEQVEGASANTRWESDGYVFVLYLRPLLPHERPCGGGDEVACVPSPMAVAAPVPDHFEHGFEADDLVLRFDSYFPAPYGTGQRLMMALYGNGSLVTSAVLPAIAPGPALWPLVAVSMTSEGIQAILKQAHLMGMMETDAQWSRSGGSEESTSLTIRANGKTTRVAIDNGKCTASMSEVEAATRARFWAFQSQVADFSSDHQDFPDWFPEGAITSGTEPYDVSRLEIIVAPVEEVQSPDAVVVSEEPGSDIEWPLATPATVFGVSYGRDSVRCAVVSGTDLDSILPAIQQANDMTLWLSDGTSFRMWPRVLLPDEAGCDLQSR